MKWSDLLSRKKYLNENHNQKNVPSSINNQFVVTTTNLLICDHIGNFNTLCKQNCKPAYFIMIGSISSIQSQIP